MNLVDSNRLFEDQYLSQTSNTFEAINMWVKDSKQIEAKYQNRLSSNESLSSALTQKVPDNLDRRKLVKDVESQYIDRYIREALSQIDDKDVRISVLQTLNHSRLEKNLVFVYLDILSDFQKSRVRIISRLIWYNLYPKKGN